MSLRIEEFSSDEIPILQKSLSRRKLQKPKIKPIFSVVYPSYDIFTKYVR